MAKRRCPFSSMVKKSPWRASTSVISCCGKIIRIRNSPSGRQKYPRRPLRCASPEGIVRQWRRVGSYEVRTRKDSNARGLNRKRQARRMRKRATNGLRRQREASRRGSRGGPEVDRRIDPGNKHERTGRIGADARGQTRERYLNSAAEAIVGNNREVYGCADAPCEIVTELELTATEKSAACGC
jgi:hypothetical protein